MSVKTSIVGLFITFIVSFLLTVYLNPKETIHSNSNLNTEKIDLGDGIEAGMRFYEVNDRLDIKFHSRDKRGCTKYQEFEDGKGKDVYYAFNDDNRKLMYRSSVKSISELKDIVEKYKKKFEVAIVREGIWFFSNGGDLGVKIIDKVKTDDKFRLWKGSISLWNEYSTYGHVDFPTK